MTIVPAARYPMEPLITGLGLRLAAREKHMTLFSVHSPLTDSRISITTTITYITDMQPGRDTRMAACQRRESRR